MRRHLFVLSLLLAPLSAQPISLGIKAGGVTTATFASRGEDFRDESKRYSVGPSVELHLRRSFSLEVDALYRRLGYDTMYGRAGVLTHERERINSWEVPILAKYRLFAARSTRPFVLAGYAVRFTGGEAVRTTLRNPFPGDNAVGVASRSSTAYENTHGFVAGGGVEWRLGRMRLSPEVRYTRWNRPFHEFYFSQVGRLAGQNQVQVLLGISLP